MTSVRRTAPEQTLAVRWPILRPGFPRESAVFDGDEAASTIHFGAFHGDQLVGVASIYTAQLPERPELTPTWQLRGMATLPTMRGLGHGRALLAACEQAVRDLGGAFLWCNARVAAAPFYSRHGWQQIGGEFDIPSVGSHFRMIREL